MTIPIAVVSALALLGGPGLAQEGASIKIGVLTDMSSIYADLGGTGSLEAAKMAAEDAGPILGRPVKVISADHQNKADVGSSIARQWYEHDDVDVVADVPNSSVALAVENLTRDLHKIALLSGPATAEITGKSCSPYTVHWTYDTYSLSHATGSALVKRGGDTWFFITVDYSAGYSWERDTSAVVNAAGGKVMGSTRFPINTPDFSSFLLQAQASKAKVIALATAGGDMINIIKQALEFGIAARGQMLAPLLMFNTDVHSLGLETAQGMLLTAPFDWNQTDETRTWSRRFFERVHRMPTFVQAGVYGSIAHYLKAVKSSGTKDPDTVMAKMRDMPIDDFMTRNGKLRIDGRVVRDMYLFEVKRPSESQGEWDLLRLVEAIPGEQVYRPLDQGGCPLAAAAARQ